MLDGGKKVTTKINQKFCWYWIKKKTLIKKDGSHWKQIEEQNKLR